MTLRALGFRRPAILTGALAESLFLALVGGIAGDVLAFLSINGFQASTIGGDGTSVGSYTPQVAFAFTVSFRVMLIGVIWALVIGSIGGMFPAIRAAPLPITRALRGN